MHYVLKHWYSNWNEVFTVEGSSHGTVVSVQDGDIVVSKFEFQSSNCVHFWIKIFGKDMNIFYLPLPSYETEAAQSAGGCRIRRLHLCRRVRLCPRNKCSGYDTKLQLIDSSRWTLWTVEYSFIAITLRSTLTPGGSTC